MVISDQNTMGRRRNAAGSLGIGLFTPNYPGLTGEGGIGTYTKDLAHGLAALGNEVVVLTRGERPAIMDGPVEVRMIRTPHLPVADRVFPGAGACWHVARALRRLVRERRVDVVEMPNWEGLGLAYQQLSRVPVVIRLSTSSSEAQQIDGLPPTRPLLWEVRRERWQGRRAAALITHSNAHRKLMSQELDVPEDRIRVIPIGIPVFPHFQRGEQTNRCPTVVYLGRLEKRKGTLDLLRAIPTVLARFAEACFVLIGADRPHCPGNRTHAQYLDEEFPTEIRRQVQLLGRLPQPEVDRWLQQADVFVAPSLYESFGLIFPETMRWGTPVIGTRVGGIPEIVTHGETGLLVEAQQPTALAAAIVQLLENRGLRERLGRAGRTHVEEKFTVERMARATSQLYAELIEQRSRRRVAAIR